MALQPYADPNQALAIYEAQQVPPEEIERRKQEAEQLDKKLRHIVEEVPDRIYNVRGSMAGAGSGEFHIYRHSKRREQERLKRIDEEAERNAKEVEREKKLAELEQNDEERTAKRRAKRQKKKDKQRNKKQKQEDGTAAAPATDNNGDNESESDKEEEEPVAQQPDLD